MKAQAGVEFLIAFGMLLLVFAISVYVYSVEVADSNELSDNLEAVRICTHVSSTISSFASVGGNSTYHLDLPEFLNHKNYTVWILSDSNVAEVIYPDSGGSATSHMVACPLQTRAVSNASGATSFSIVRNATITGTSGSLVIG